MYIPADSIKGGLIMTVKIQKWGNSQGIRIPKYILDELTWNENETVDLMVQNGKIIIERTKPSTRQNIYELFDGYKGKYEPSEIDWGDPSGREIW